MLTPVRLTEKFAAISDCWNPRVAGEVNDCAVKLVKFIGDFMFHHHENEDEMFFVVKGRFTMKLRDGDIELREGDFLIVPRGVEHCPSASEECWVMMIEPKTTLNTGNVENERTRKVLQRI